MQKTVISESDDKYLEKKSRKPLYGGHKLPDELKIRYIFEKINNTNYYLV